MASLWVTTLVVMGVGWRAPATCPGETEFHELVTGLLGGESPDNYAIDVDVHIRDHDVDGYQLAMHAMPHIRGLTSEFATTGTDCAQLASFAAAWTATQIDPLGLGPEVEEQPPIAVPNPSEVRSSEPSQPTVQAPRQATGAAPALPSVLPERHDQPAGVLTASVGAGIGLASPVGTAVSARAGVRWRSMQVTAAGYTFIDTGLTSPVEPIDDGNPHSDQLLRQKHRLVVWSVGPELCWVPSLRRVLVSACANVDGGQLHLQSEVDDPRSRRWLRVGASANVGFRAGKIAEPFLSLGFSQVLADVVILVNGPDIGPTGSFVTLSIGTNFVIRHRK